MLKHKAMHCLERCCFKEKRHQGYYKRKKMNGDRFENGNGDKVVETRNSDGNSCAGKQRYILKYLLQRE